MSDLNKLTIKEALDKLSKKEISATDLVSDCLNQIDKYNDKINAFITVDKDNALKQAQQLDKEGIDHNSKPLAGIPVALKDIYVTKDLRSTGGSKILDNYIPQYDATIVKRLKDAGAIIIGKLAEDAWGHGASGENTDYRIAKNPYNTDYVAGGSSSGSGAAPAADMCLAAGGTDTGGSIRNPASFCNLVGLKPTYGRVSRYGVMAMASSLDSMGHLTRTVWDNAKYLEVVAGKDPLDGTTPDVEVPKYTQEIDNVSLKGLKIGVPKEYFGEGLDPELGDAIKKAIKSYEDQGAKVTEISLPHTEYGAAVYYVLMSSETSSNMGRYDGIRYGNTRENFTPETKRRIMLGTYSLSSGYYDAYYKKAAKVRTLIKQDFDKAFAQVDVAMAPVVPTPAEKFGSRPDPLQMYLWDILSIPTNLAGIPSLALQCGFNEKGLPLGMHIMGPQFSESKLFQIGHAYQQITDWHTRKPQL